MNIAKLCLNGLVCTERNCQLWVEGEPGGTCTFKALGYELHEISEQLRLLRKEMLDCFERRS